MGDEMKYIEGIPTPEQLAVINALERHKNVSSDDEIRKMNEEDVSKFIMAMNNRDRVVGELRYINVPHPYVQTLSVDPRYRNKGVGAGLLGNVLSKDEITTLHVLERNANARRLYERLGFEPANEQDPGNSKDLPLLVYVPQQKSASVKIIEEPTPEQIKQVALINQAAFSYPKDIDRYVASEARKNEKILLMTGKNDNPLAALVYRMMGEDAPHVMDFSVAKKYRNRGLGEKMLKHVMNQHGTVTLNVNNENEKARRFYERLGFVAVPTAPFNPGSQRRTAYQWVKKGE